jgi:hypothetical protein
VAGHVDGELEPPSLLVVPAGSTTTLGFDLPAATNHCELAFTCDDVSGRRHISEMNLLVTPPAPVKSVVAIADAVNLRVSRESAP